MTIQQKPPPVNPPKKKSDLPWSRPSEEWGPDDLHLDSPSPENFGPRRKIGAGLGNHGKFASLQNRKKRRRETFHLRGLFRQFLNKKYRLLLAELRRNDFVSTPFIEKLRKVANIQTCWCGIREIPRKRRADGSDHVEIVINKGIASYTKVRYCKNAKYCACCAQQKFRAEQVNISKLLEKCQENSWTQIMLTLTRPHGRHDKLLDLLKDFSAAQRRLFSGQSWENLRKSVGYVGMVRSEEILFGPQHGWHPHQHIVIIVEKCNSSQKNEIKKYFKNAWNLYGRKLGWVHGEKEESWFDERGTDLKFGKISDNYLTKSLSCELASPNTKSSEAGLISVWEIIRRALDEPFYDMKLMEYVLAVRGRSAIRWSPGLRKHIELIDVIEEEGEVLYHMSARDFRYLGRFENVLPILEAIEEKNVEVIEFYIKNCGLVPVSENC